MFQTLIDKLIVLLATALLRTHLYTTRVLHYMSAEIYLLLFINNHIISCQSSLILLSQEAQQGI